MMAMASDADSDDRPRDAPSECPALRARRERRTYYAIGYELRREAGKKTRGPGPSALMPIEGKRAVSQALGAFWCAALRWGPLLAEDLLVYLLTRGMPERAPELWAEGLPRWVVDVLRARWEREGRLEPVRRRQRPRPVARCSPEEPAQ